ncbi:Receptor-like serine/threonine-protein kinase SD1-7 [Thalictrum thalictroides]|uniref:Receptor-like serine/threonine-protein kinase SD1-7 n=1 Tax=Thalictrum thalictroides TaxID=46969 RepID=A0A7J6VAE8_THATH|nr:Receptor-like serine/threonine-protein kinase SD1-7 [Thalictrum thalictroides]
MWQEVIIYWTSGLFSGRSFARVRNSGVRHLFNYSFVRNDEEQYFNYSFYNKSIISRFVLQYAGQIQLFTWSVEAQTWTELWAHPEDRCGVYAPCGAYGSCSTNTSSLCRCLQGFVPVSPRDWESDNWSNGCRRRTEIDCGNNDAFLQFKTLKLPDHMQYIEGIGPKNGNCKSMCASNCSCTAYSHVNETGCLFWGVDLMGLRENYNKTGQADGDQEIFIRIASSDLVGGNTPLPLLKKNQRIWVIVAATVTSALVILGFLMHYIWKITPRPEGNTKRSQDRFALEYGINITAAGKGTLPEGQEIAIKRLSRSSGQGLEEFKNEIILIAKLQHTNLVRLLGCCIEVEEKMLIYEYMVNGSLDSFIFDLNKRMKLDGQKRVHIIEGIAQGLLYLHKYSRLKVIHRDVKASNILLDGEMNPKISDFGMARIFSNNESEANTRRIVGTYGYMSPEYAMNGKFSVKSDVYSFGVLLLEIISGTKNSSYDHLDSSFNILGYAYILWKGNKAVELVDPLLDNSSPTNELVRYIHIALLCVQESASDRPTMVEVVSMLGNETTNLPTPKQPAFFIERNVVQEDSPPEAHGVICSANGSTISLVEGR